MRKKRKVICRFADTLECFIVASTRGGCLHIKKHYKDYSCNVDYCLKTEKHNVYCERVKGKKQCSKKKKKQLSLARMSNFM